MILLTTQVGSPIALNPAHINVILPREDNDEPNIHCRIFVITDDEFPILIQEDFESVVNQVSNALAFSIVSRESSD